MKPFGSIICSVVYGADRNGGVFFTPYRIPLSYRICLKLGMILFLSFNHLFLYFVGNFKRVTAIFIAV